MFKAETEALFLMISSSSSSRTSSSSLGPQTPARELNELLFPSPPPARELKELALELRELHPDCW